MCCYKVPFVTLSVLVVAYGEPCSSDETCPPNMAGAEDADSSSLMQLRKVTQTLQPAHEAASKSTGAAHVFMHMPFNFGNTIEKVAMFKPGTGVHYVERIIDSWTNGSSFAGGGPASWAKINKYVQPGGEVWGHFNPDLHAMSKITNCPLYLTPPKYWPQDVAAKYVGNKTVFGVIRDPFEKLVAQFRGGMKDYGGDEADSSCDVNAGVKKHLKMLKASGDMFQGNCTNLPQAEFFEGPYGIKVPIDNWRLPKSANDFFEKNGYPWRIKQQDIMHVTLCNDHWSAMFDAETRSLVRELYSKDFDIICANFGHCDFDQSTCLMGVHQMCPEDLFMWDFNKGHYCPRQPIIDEQMLGTGNTRIWPECLVPSA